MKELCTGVHRKRAGAARTALRLTVVLCFHAMLFLFLLGLHLVLQYWLCNFHHIIESFDNYFTGYFFCAPFSKIENTRMLGCMVLLHHLIYHFLPFCIWKCSYFYYYLQVPPLFLPALSRSSSVQALTEINSLVCLLLEISVLGHFPCQKEPWFICFIWFSNCLIHNSPLLFTTRYRSRIPDGKIGQPLAQNKSSILEKSTDLLL